MSCEELINNDFRAALHRHLCTLTFFWPACTFPINKTENSVISYLNSDISASRNWFVLPQPSQQSNCHQETCNDPVMCVWLSVRVGVSICLLVFMWVCLLSASLRCTCLCVTVCVGSLSAHTRVYCLHWPWAVLLSWQIDCSAPDAQG